MISSPNGELLLNFECTKLGYARLGGYKSRVFLLYVDRMLPVVIGLLAFGVTIPGFEAIAYWKKAELQFNSTKYHFPTENSDGQNQLTIAVNNHQSSNDTRFGAMYGSRESSTSKVENNEIGSTWDIFRASDVFRPRYKSFNTTCDQNVYKVYSNNEKSTIFKNNYELWSDANYYSDSSNHKIRRSEPDEEFNDDGHFTYDDDYSLLNYVDHWKGRNKETADGRGQTMKREMLKKKNSKREAEDKEFSVMFHSRKNHELKDKFSNNYDFNKNGKKKSRLHSEKKKHKHEFGVQHERKMNFMERRNNLKESYNRDEGTPVNPISSKKKYSFWPSKKEKLVAKVVNFGGMLLTTPKAFTSPVFPPRKLLHWATTRSYVAEISKRNLMTPIHLTSARLAPPEIVPFLNPTDPILTQRKSGLARSSATPVSMNRAAVLVNQSGSPQYLRLGNENLDIRNLNSNLPFPLSFNIPLAKQSENDDAVYGPPVIVTTPVLYFLNAPTEVINPLLNHCDTFKNTTTWNAKQGPPGSLNAFSNLASLINYQIDNAASNLSDIPVEQALPYLQQQEKTQKSVGTDLVTLPSVETQLVQDLQSDSLTVDYQAGLDLTPSPIIGAEAIVNFLQNALLSQSGALNEQVSEATETIVTSTKESIKVHEQPIDNNLIRILDSKNHHLDSISSTRAVITEAVPLFTTEEPLMNRFSDFINRNADRKIPIVYDIEEAPQLIPKNIMLNMTSLGHVLHEMPSSRIDRHIINCRSNIKKNKTATTDMKNDKTTSNSIKNNKTATTIMKKDKALKKTNMTTPWFFLTTTENMLYSEMKMQYLLQSTNKPKVKNKKIHLFFNIKAKTNATTSGSTVTTQMRKTAKPLTSAAPKEKGRERKAITNQQSYLTKSVTTEETEQLLVAARGCCCCCQNCNDNERATKQVTDGCGCSSTSCRYLTCGDPPTKHPAPPLDVTTPISCVPYNISVGSISCPSCHQEFTYKLGFKNLIV